MVSFKNLVLEKIKFSWRQRQGSIFSFQDSPSLSAVAVAADVVIDDVAAVNVVVEADIVVVDNIVVVVVVDVIDEVDVIDCAA